MPAAPSDSTSDQSQLVASLFEAVGPLLAASFGTDARTRAVLNAELKRASALAQAGGTGLEHARLVALTFVADSLAGLAVERGLARDEADALLGGLAGLLELPPDFVENAVFLQAVRDPRFLALPTRLAVELELSLLVALTPVVEASLWAADPGDGVRCFVHVGGGSPTRRMRAVATHVLRCGRPRAGAPRGLIHAVSVARWEQTVAALAIRTASAGRSRAIALACEAAPVLSVVLERETLLERSVAKERSLVEAGERRLVRLGFDIHDGPIQAIAALAGDVRLFKKQLERVLPQDEPQPLLGRVDDLLARLVEVDRELRELAQSLESPSILRRSLEDVLRREVDSFASSNEIGAKLELSGSFGELSASQRIALVRVVQEALTNVREHSGASEVDVAVSVRLGFVQATIVDNGRGFDVEKALLRAAKGGRLGLVGMSERVRLLGGTFDIASRVGGPTKVSLALPEWRPLSAEQVASRADPGR